MLVPIFSGSVDGDARLHLADNEAPQRLAWLQSLAGKEIELVVRRKRSQRTLDQSAYLHAVPFALLADYWGEDMETTKLLCLGECFGWRDTARGRIPMKPSTSALTVEETSHLIEWLPPWALAEFNVHIPLPEKVAA